MNIISQEATTRNHIWCYFKLYAVTKMSFNLFVLVRELEKILKKFVTKKYTWQWSWYLRESKDKTLQCAVQYISVHSKATCFPGSLKLALAEMTENSCERGKNKTLIVRYRYRYRWINTIYISHHYAICINGNRLINTLHFWLELYL